MVSEGGGEARTNRTEQSTSGLAITGKRLLEGSGNGSWKILEDATGRSWKRIPWKILETNSLETNSLEDPGNGGSWKMMGFPVPGTPRNWGFQSLGVSGS